MRSIPSLSSTTLATWGALAFAATPLAAQQARDPQILVTGTVGAPDGIALSSENFDVSAMLYTDTGDQTIWVRRSDGRGLSWDPAIRIDSDATGAPKASGRHSLVVDGGRIYAAWLDERNGSNDDLYFNFSNDGGATWQPSDQRIDDSFNPGLRDVKDFRIASSGDDVVALLSVEDHVERLYITWSNNGGQTWKDAIPASTHNGIGDIDDIALAASGDRAYFAWRDNFTNGVDDSVWFSCFDLKTGTFIHQDVAISPNLVAGAGDADDAVEISVDDSHVAVVFHADNLGSPAEQVRAAFSDDLGATWAPDEQIGSYDNTVAGHDVDDAVVLVEDGQAAVAWTDNRSGIDQVYVATLDLTTGIVTPDHQCSDTTISAGSPRLAGEFGSETLAVAWNQFDGRVAKACSLRNGLWTDAFLLSQNTADVSNVRLAWNDVYDNFVALWIAAETLTDEVYVGGFRGQQVQADQLAAGAPALLSVHGFTPSTSFQVVASGSPGSLRLLDGRNLGLTVDTFLRQTSQLPQLTGVTDVTGSGSTQPLPVPANLSGTPLWLAAASFTASGAIQDLSDATPVVVQ